jgi:peptidoglycan/LPS O-acetylase OafA/YrhL
MNPANLPEFIWNLLMGTTARAVSVDVARGALMLYIVLIIHGAFWLHLLPQEVRYALLFEMPCIFIISGYAYSLYENSPGRIKPLQSQSHYLSFLTARITRILVPYYLYALVCLIIYLILIHSFTRQGASVWQVAASWLNPLNFGDGYSFGRLNGHLWFIAPFLAVTAMLPWLCKIPVFTKLPLWGYMAGGILLMYFCSFLNSYFLKTTIFYFIWAAFGYHLAKPEVKLGVRDYLPVFLFSLLVLVMSQLITPAPFSLNMQANKFPPNAVFFMFSCAWISLLLMLMPSLDKQWLEKLSETGWFKPFITYGYSIYLWQGLGFTMAISAGEQFKMPAIIVLFAGLAITIGLGVLAGPMERLRIRR